MVLLMLYLSADTELPCSPGGCFTLSWLHGDSGRGSVIALLCMLVRGVDLSGTSTFLSGPKLMDVCLLLCPVNMAHTTVPRTPTVLSGPPEARIALSGSRTSRPGPSCARTSRPSLLHPPGAVLTLPPC